MQGIRRNLPEVLACLVVAIFGLAALWIGTDYPMGSLTRMGPGFFPVMVSLLVVFFVVLAAVEALRSDGRKTLFKWRPVIFVSAGILAWTLLIEPLGIVISTFALIGISSLAQVPYRMVSVLLMAAGLCIAGYSIFVVGLAMPLTLFAR